MAGEWIKLARKPDDPKILRLSYLTKIPRDTVYRMVIEWFFHVDEHYVSGTAAISREAFGCIVHDNPRKGRLFDAMMDRGVQWLSPIEDGLADIPEFDEHFSESAKRRAVENKRKARTRSGTQCGTDCGQNTGQNAPKNALPERERELERESEVSLSDSQDGLGGISVSGSEGHQGIRTTTLLHLLKCFGVPDDPGIEPSGRQHRSNWTTLRRAADGAVTAPDPQAARQQAAELLRLAEQAKRSARVKPIRKFMTDYKRNYPGVFPEKKAHA